MEKRLLTIILPTYNESKNVKEIISQIDHSLFDMHDSFEILFVDDSTDETTQIISEEISRDSRIRIIHRSGSEKNGLAGAFVDGFRQANSEYICCMDSDLQHSPIEIPVLLKKIMANKADLVIGSRYIRGGSAEGLGSFYRKAVSITAKNIAKTILFPLQLGSDPGSGFFIFKKDLFDGVELFPKGFKILIEIIARANPKKIAEVPIQFLPRENNESKANFSQGIEFLKHLSLIFTQVSRAGRFLKFCIVGAIGAIVNLGSLFILVDLVHIDQLYAWGYAIVFSIISNFILNSNITYNDQKHNGILSQAFKFIRFFAASLFALILNFYVYKSLLNFGVYYLFADMVGIFFGMGINFAMAQYLIWNKKVEIATLRKPWKIWEFVYNRISFSILFWSVILGIFAIFVFNGYQNLPLLNYFIPIFSLIVSIQGIFALFLMLYGWEDPERIGKDSSPKEYLSPKYSFTAIVPARHESLVIEDTIRAINAIDYPRDKKEILIVCREDDKETIGKVNDTIATLPSDNIKLIIFDGFPINKPHGLNIALKKASNDVVTVFDAEDEPHPDIFNIINTVMVRDGADVVQSGVQLMNYNSRWFSLFNVVEYYFWFKSTLHFFAEANLIPLGGNTVFFKRECLNDIGGWDEKCLTEDADIGIRLSLRGVRVRVVYDEQHVTREEAPDTIGGFIKQRTRWNHGFLQILFKREWLRLPKFSQRLLAFYVLTSPIVQAIMFLYAPIAIWMIFSIKLPTIVTLIAMLPLYILILHFITYLVGLYEFTKDYKLKFFTWLPLWAIIFYYPFQIMMGISVFRAIIRNMLGTTAWEKTEHLNLHREKRGTVVSISAPIKMT